MRKAEERGREKARYGQGKAADLPNRSVLHFSPSPPKRPHQFCLRQDMTFHRRVDILAVDWGAQVQDRVEGIEPEEIPVGFAGRGTGAAVTIHGEVVDALLAAARHGVARGHAFRQLPRRRPAGCTPPSEPRFRAGASGSSTISTKLCVRGGGWFQEREGETLAPLHVNCVGIVPPGRKAVVFNSSFPEESLATKIFAARRTSADGQD